ncbi:MAG: hypothetical protein IKE46_01180 [Selenomonadaceae bacterium]|nr:hypothetical protein [Selenomonadaceae bacterium]
MKFVLKPVTRDKHGKFVSEYEYRDFYSQIGEALMTAHETACWISFLAAQNADDRRLKDEAQYEICELIDLMTAVATRIKALADEHGYTTSDLAEMQKRVIESNRNYGQFEELTKPL